MSKKKTKHYPNGLHFLEPLYAIIKSLLILILLIMSVIVTLNTALDYFIHGNGDILNVGPVLPYTILMGILCFGLGLFNDRQNKIINNSSTILSAESKANYIDGLQSLGIGVAVFFLYFIDIDSFFGFFWYTGDFFITFLLVIISIKDPISVLWNSFKELTNGTTNNKDVIQYTNKIVCRFLNPITKDFNCKIIKTGMYIEIKLAIKEAITHDKYLSLMKAKEKIHAEIKLKYENINIVFVF